MHLFFSMSFQLELLESYLYCRDLQLPPINMIIEARNAFGSHISKEIVITPCWIIWTTRNRAIFDNASFSLIRWVEDFKELGLRAVLRIVAREYPLAAFLFLFLGFESFVTCTVIYNQKFM